jgi:hypothetical protein
VEYLLFVGYLLLFAWLVTKVNFFTRSGLSKSQLMIIFFLKVIAAIFYGWVGIYYGGYAKMWDTWAFHTSGLYEYHLLQTDPHEYLTNLFRNGYEDGMNRFFESRNSYWNDLKGNVFVKMLSVFDLLSQGHYYVNVIFYSFLSLFGPIALYRVMKDAFPGKKRLILFSLFGFPSFLYWTSGIHKEGMIFTGIAISVYCIYFAHKEGRFSGKKIIALLLSVILVLILRNFVAILLIPALFTLHIANKYKKHGLLIFSSLYVLFIILFFNIRQVIPRLDFPGAVVEKQQAFIKIKRGKTTVPIKALEPTALSFLENTPQALSLTVLRPYPKDVHHLLSLVSVIEMNLLYLLVLLFLWKRNRDPMDRNLIYFCLFFAFSVLLAIGFSNNNIGAIVRYRTVVIPFLIIPLVVRINWIGIAAFFKINK